MITNAWISGNRAIRLTAINFNCPWHVAEKWLEEMLGAGKLQSRRCGVMLDAASWRARGRWYGTDWAKDPWSLTDVDLGTDWHFEIALPELQACIRIGLRARGRGNGPSPKIATGKRGRPARWVLSLKNTKLGSGAEKPRRMQRKKPDSLRPGAVTSTPT
jgi:hypothetical protein